MAKKQKQKIKQEVKPAATGTGQMAKSDQKHRSEIVRAEIQDANKQVETEYLKLARLLNEAYHREYYLEWGFEDWRSYTENELDVHYRKSMYFVDVWDTVKKLNLPLAQVEKLGWTKMKDLTRVMTEKNAKEWMEKAKKMSTRELTEEVKVSRKREAGKATGPETIKLHLIMGEDEGNIILDAIEEAKKLCESSNDVIALGMICQDWQEMKGARPERSSLEAHLRFLKKVYGVDVAQVDLGAKKEAPKETKLKKGKKKEEVEPEAATASPEPEGGDLDLEDLLSEGDGEDELSKDVTDALGI